MTRRVPQRGGSAARLAGTASGGATVSGATVGGATVSGVTVSGVTVGGTTVSGVASTGATAGGAQRVGVRQALWLGAMAMATSGCGSCGGAGEGTSGTETTPTASTGGPAAAVAVLPPRVPPPEPWAFAGVRGPPGIAAPPHCRQRAPLLVAKVERTTHFVSDARSLGVLAVAETQLEPPAVLRSGVLSLADDGTTRAGAWLPWPFARSAPRLARAGEGWVGAWEVPGEDGMSDVVLLRDGAVEALGSGDAFVVADLACGASRCALLTSRAARVAPAGADVVVIDGAAHAPRRTIVLEPDEDAGHARPFGLAAVDGARGPVAVLTSGAEATFWRTEGEGAPTPFARIPLEHGALDATLLGDRAIVMAHGNVVDEAGCAREGSDAAGARIRFLRPGEPAAEVRSPGAPSLAALRPLAAGALALWLTPLGCGAERHVVYGVVLDRSGAPAGTPIPIGDGDTFVAAASGADVDLWIRRAAEIAWVRLTCAAP